MAKLQPGQAPLSLAPVVIAGSVLALIVSPLYFWVQSQWLLPQGVWQALWELLVPSGGAGICFGSLTCQTPADPQTTAHLLLWVFGSTLGVAVGVGITGGSVLYGYLKGQRMRPPATVAIRGATLATAASINALTLARRTQEDGPHLKIGEVIYPRYLEVLSMLTCGSPGAGKTTVIQSMLMTINQRPDKVCIYDCNGDYLKKFYNPARGDVVLGLSPLATHSWNIWDEFPDGRGFQKFCELAVPKDPASTYYVDNARIILYELVKVLAPSKSWKKLREIIACLSPQEIAAMVPNTPAMRPLLGQYGDNILSGVNSRTAWLDHLSDPQPRADGTSDAFSFHAWATSPEPAWVFLLVPEEYSAESAPILAMWFDLVAQATMQRQVDHTGFSRLWLILDELASASYQPRLKNFLAVGRKYGGCAILGFQLVSQVRDIYGPNETDTLFGLCQTKLILRTADGNTCEALAKTIGTQDYYEATTSTSESEQAMSVSAGYQRRTDFLFLPSQLMALPQFHGVLVLPTLPTSQVVLTREAQQLPSVPLPPARVKVTDPVVQTPVLTLVKGSSALSPGNIEDENEEDSYELG
ncbi:type IV secretion system DNA-binding domain-containing protein [Candidatus Cyanaurora vandensis]|uniref:type IV secretion system DNA-binding domain-containing protein n=1 Tax=Candidatus Cyanaurora vandensis TaxID=2714958 RepID=UPI00257CE29B|nr:type IV secretion system DNA-binding domain-containing protein [Candidatus Cyanaurora vandensis]